MTTIPRILVVEDEAIIARDIAVQLGELGYEALGPVNSGERAIELATQEQPDLVLMDIHLATAMDGITAAQQIRGLCAARIVFLSAFTGHGGLDRAKETRPAGYLAKPFDEFELRDMLRSVLTGEPGT